MQSRKHIESEFICKIVDMMQTHSELIRWTNHQTELELIDIDEIQESVLPHYFRHNNFNSFLRQLNMYNFVKVQRKGKSMTFRNQQFYKGNEDNFFLIQRRRKFADLDNFEKRFYKQSEKVLANIRKKSQITPCLQQSIISLLEYKFIGFENFKKIKCELETICQELKETKNQKLRELCQEIRGDLMVAMNSLIKQSKNIDKHIEENLLKEQAASEDTPQASSSTCLMRQLPSSPQSQSPERGSNQAKASQINECILSRQFPLKNPNAKMLLDTGSEKQRQELNDSHGGVNQTSNSKNSLDSVPVMQQYHTKKDNLAYQNGGLHLYNCFNSFNSQRSFIFMPNYIGYSSGAPYQGLENANNASLRNSIHGEANLNAHNREYEGGEDIPLMPLSFEENDSASISFVKDLEHSFDQDDEPI